MKEVAVKLTPAEIEWILGSIDDAPLGLVSPDDREMLKGLVRKLRGSHLTSTGERIFSSIVKRLVEG